MRGVASTHCFANRPAALLRLVVAALCALLLLLGRALSLSVVSLGVAVDVQDVRRAQRPLEQLVRRAAAAADFGLGGGGGFLGARRRRLVLQRLGGTRVCRRLAALLLLRRTSSVGRFLSAGFGLGLGLWPGFFLLLGLKFDSRFVWKRNTTSNILLLRLNFS